MQIWIALGGLTFAILLQAIFFAFYMGKQSETVNSLKRRVDTLEGKPIINHEAKLATIDATLVAIQNNMKDSETRLDERFKSLEGTFRNMVQLATARRNKDDT